MRAIDIGFGSSRNGFVLVSTALLARLLKASVTDKSKKRLLVGIPLVPFVHITRYATSL